MTERVPIKLKVGQTGVDAGIEIDGIDMSGSVARVAMFLDVDDVTRVYVEFLGVEVEAEGEFFDMTSLGSRFKEWIARKNPAPEGDQQ